MRHGSLFSGIGGFDLAAEWMGWENVFHCEWNEFNKTILKYYWPNAESYSDILQTDFTVHRETIDIITGGFPCQPFSTAGKRKGKEDERHLWPEMLRAIREIQPRWVVGENVSGIINWSRGLVVDEIKNNLEDAGFTLFSPVIIPACAKNAPHRRERIWFIAHANSCRQSRQKTQTNKVLRHERILQETWNDFEPKTYANYDGISERLDTETLSFKKWREYSLAAAGNAIVPQVAYEIFKAIEEFEKQCH